ESCLPLSARIVTLDEELAHVRQVEQPGALTNRAVLVEDARVLHRHEPAAELDEARAERPVDGDEGRLTWGIGVARARAGRGRRPRLRHPAAPARTRPPRARATT